MITVEMDFDTRSAQGCETVVHLPTGLLGFEQHKKYLLTRHEDEDPFHRLSVLGDPSLSFLVLSPFEALPDYQPNVPSDDARSLALERPEDAYLLGIVTLRPRGRSTINLKGPIVVNRFTLTARQVILANASQYSVQHPLPEE